MQYRKSTNQPKPLATDGRTIHRVDHADFGDVWDIFRFTFDCSQIGASRPLDERCDGLLPLADERSCRLQLPLPAKIRPRLALRRLTR